MRSVYVYIVIMAAVSYLIRSLPMTLLKGRVKSRFVQSFLYYVPYATLAVMTFPAMVMATQSPLSGIAALLVGIVSAWYGAGLFRVALFCCMTVFFCELIVL